MGLLLLSSLSCTDRLPTADDPPATPPGATAEYLNCLMNVDDGGMQCVREGGGGTAGATGFSPALLERFFDFTLRASNAVYTPQDSTLRAMVDVAAYLLDQEPIGTHDGQTLGSGVKVFLEGGPYVALFRDSGDVADPWFRNQLVGPTGPAGATWLNPDGHASFTGPNQPYMEYAQVLQPGHWSAQREWRFKVVPEAKLIGFRAKIFTSTQSENHVPAVAPDTVPEGFYDSANVMLNSPYFGLSRRVIKDIVAIRFTATATRDERQAAVDVIRGQVVGGHRPSPAMEGSYFVRIDDDGTGLQMRAAVDTLIKMPTVATIKPEYLWLASEFLAYVEPGDDGDWEGAWQPNPTLADGDNWGLEAIAAPHAWGCTTGSPGTKVAVLDMGYFSNPDLTANTTYAPAMDAYVGKRSFGDTHGTGTSSLIAAQGNNQQGITGVMWDADLRLYDVSVADNGDRNMEKVLRGLFGQPVPLDRLIQDRLLQAISSGAHVINISLAGTVKYDSVPQAEWEREISIFANELYHIIQSSPNKPLIVVGAGNTGEDAYWAMFPYLVRLLPGQVIAVGGVSAVREHEGLLWNKSNVNTASPGYNLVEIAAPAVDVGVLAPSGTAATTGTSNSAPLVAGIAGLLKSFDTRLTAPEIKALLIEGARRGGRHVYMPSGSVYLANAYQSLVAASERPGAPLCGGQPVYRDEEFGLVMARRIVAGTAKPAELLFNQPGPDLVPMHAFTAMRVGPNYYSWFDGSWMALPFNWPDPLGNATNRSRMGQSHDGDSTVTVSRVEVSNTQETYKVHINGALLANVPSTWAKKPSVTQCVRYPATGSGCYAQLATWYDRITTHTAVGYSPRGDEVVLAIWKQKSTYRVEIPYLCSSTSQYCRDHGLEVTTLPSELVFIRISDGTIVQRRAGPTRAVPWLGYSEDGQRLVLGTQFTYAYSTSVTSTNDLYQANTYYCQAQYMTRGGTTLATLPLKLQHSQCYNTATFSP
jgi:subtilisin family serine protease